MPPRRASPVVTLARAATEPTERSMPPATMTKVMPTTAIGSNEATARLCGVRVERTKRIVYAISGLCAGIAGTLLYARLTVGDPTGAIGMELQVVAAVVIGGASLSGGEGTILGTVLGALLLSVMANGCSLLGISNAAQEMLTGAIIVAAVAIDAWRHRRG